MMKRITGLVVVLALSGCAGAPWSKSKVEGKTPEERVANVKKAIEKNQKRLERSPETDPKNLFGSQFSTALPHCQRTQFEVS